MPLQSDLPFSKSAPQRDEAERNAWLERLRLHLQDPDFRSIPGFPHGSDEAILTLSDPPYYTACPNPFLEEILKAWQREREAQREDEAAALQREPFATDVSEGKNDPIYNAHSYHTKVPHKAIMRYILHYTEPGDIVFDGFAGTGMTGVAAQLCGDRKAVQSLGYRVDEEGHIWDGEKRISRLGARRAVLVDLSPAATFIAYNYNTPVDAQTFEREARRILEEVEAECGWMYETRHTDGKTRGKINYTVWSDVFRCPACGGEMVFWDVAVDHEAGKVRREWHCPSCGALLSKSPPRESRAQRVERVFETRYDRAIGQSVRQARQVPVLINYSVGKKRYQKRPDEHDLALIEKIENSEIPYPFPTQPMMFKGDNWGDTWRAGVHAGLTHVHHFYTRRNLWVLAALFAHLRNAPSKVRHWLTFTCEQAIMGMSKWARYVPSHYSQVNQGLSGTLYIASQVVEASPSYILNNKISRLKTTLGILSDFKYGSVSVSTQSSTMSSPLSQSIDYIFVDPPFGSNLMYSELNFLWEAWLGVFTDNAPEAVVNKSQRKGLPEYQALMETAFREFYRLLKPGGWMTVEFHNSKNAVWNAIQEAILQAGFMLADVRTLDKQQGTFKQVTSAAAVKQDLIISAYKPAGEFEQRFLAAQGSPEGAWAFIRQHLERLAKPKLTDKGMLTFIGERAPYLLYDRMVAYHIQRGLSVPLSAPEFYAGLKERFAERDGMVFTFPQAAEFDALRIQAERVEQLPLFITDEKSAIQWLRRALDPERGGGPRTYGDLANEFKKELHQLSYEALPELRALLEDNFLQDEAGRWYLPDPSKAGDLYALREKDLLREFTAYTRGKKRLKTFRLEAVRAGFRRAWQERDYKTIVRVAERLPSRVFEDDPQLMMYADNARLRLDAQPRQERLL